MQTQQILALLIAERDKLERAIAALQGTAKRRGRPPKNFAPEQDPQKVADKEKTKKKRKGMSAATRRKMALAQKKRWAAKKAAT